MGDSSSSSSSSPASESFFRKHWEGYKEFWTERFSFLENYSRFVNRDKPLPSWSDSDVDHFIASDPVHGPTVKLSLSLSLLIGSFGFISFRLLFLFLIFLAYAHLGICFLMGLRFFLF